uniref:Probable serine/threonine-protein kinase DDB_G0282963 isoform X1 n=2 Tax=Dermatophagoides pteronyssinus TaxID=6956 RepID=A0A6P6XTR3_DERPT|nr:probable serine/threonine-protein kinase DDB_G0282963 isoform X1 [Dermatophagoides pteronyssinus]
MLNTINADDNNDNNVGGGNKSNPNDKTSSNVSSKSTTTAAAQNVKNLTSKLLLRSTLLGSMSSLSRHSNQRSPSPAQLFMQQHQHQQQQQQQQHQQQQQLQQQQLQQLQQLQQQILEKPSSITWPQSTVQHSTQTTTSCSKSTIDLKKEEEKNYQQEKQKQRKNNNIQQLRHRRESSSSKTNNNIDENDNNLVSSKVNPHHRQKINDYFPTIKMSQTSSSPPPTPRSSRSTSSASSSSSSSSSTSNVSLVKNGIDLGPKNGGNGYYNPANTFPIPVNRLSNFSNNNHWYPEQETTFSNTNNNMKNQSYMTQTQTFLAYHQNHPKNTNNNNNNNNGINGKHYKSSNNIINDRMNERINSTTVAIGMSTMFSSPSLLALAQPPPSINYQSNSMSRSYQERLDNSVLNTNEKPYLSAKKSPFRKHPLIEITRTRALSRAKLKQSSQVSALLSGFALVAMVEMDIQTPSTIPLSVLMFFITVTTMLVSVHMIALMISTCILPHIESMNAMQDLALTLGTNDNPIINFSDHDETIVTPSGIIPLINDNHIASTVKETNVADQLMSDASIYYGTTPHQKMSRYISIAWFFSTVIGIFLFMLELVAIVWVKFWDHHRDTNEQIGGGQNDNKNNININNNNNNNNQWLSDGKFVAIVASLILIPVLLALIFFAYHFYRKLVLIKWELTQKVLDELNNIADGLSAGEHI